MLIRYPNRAPQTETGDGDVAEVRGRRQGLTGHKVPKANGGDGDEGIVETFDVVPLFRHHEHKGWDHQVDQDAPHDEDGRARDLSLALVG